MGSEGEDLPLSAGSSIATLLHVLEEREPADASVWKASAVALNLHYLRDVAAFETEYLSDGDEVAFLPPVSGGCDGG